VVKPLLDHRDEAIEFAEELLARRGLTNGRRNILGFYNRAASEVNSVSRVECGPEFSDCQVALAAIDKLSEIEERIPIEISKHRTGKRYG
jgi:hypothetical protein